MVGDVVHEWLSTDPATLNQVIGDVEDNWRLVGGVHPNRLRLVEFWLPADDGNVFILRHLFHWSVQILDWIALRLLRRRLRFGLRLRWRWLRLWLWWRRCWLRLWFWLWLGFGLRLRNVILQPLILFQNF